MTQGAFFLWLLRCPCPRHFTALCLCFPACALSSRVKLWALCLQLVLCSLISSTPCVQADFQPSPRSDGYDLPFFLNIAWSVGWSRPGQFQEIVGVDFHRLHLTRFPWLRALYWTHRECPAVQKVQGTEMGRKEILAFRLWIFLLRLSLVMVFHLWNT